MPESGEIKDKGHVALVGMIAPFEGTADEIWCVNRAFKRQNGDRVSEYEHLGQALRSHREEADKLGRLFKHLGSDWPDPEGNGDGVKSYLEQRRDGLLEAVKNIEKERKKIAERPEAIEPLPPLQPCTRAFFFDDPRGFSDSFVEELNALPEPTRLVSRKKWAEIPRSEPYPYDDVVRHFNGLEYFASTACYMVALAVKEGFSRITLSGMYYTHDSSEYFLAKPCMEHWLGIAMGLGRHVQTTGECGLLRPWPWSTAKYGYVRQRGESLAVQTMACAYRACMGLPTSFVDADELSGDEERKAGDVCRAIATGTEKVPDWVQREAVSLPPGEGLDRKQRELEIAV